MPGSRGKEDSGRPSLEVPWAAEEDAALLRTIHAFGNGNWELVADVLASLTPHRYRSAKACYERCTHTLLAREDMSREPGSLLSEPHHAAARAPPGSLAALPDYELCVADNQPPLASGAHVGVAMRQLEAMRANSLQPPALQAETTAQVELFAVVEH